MAEPRHEDPIVAARYRDLPLEEPSPALDDAIRAAARRAVHASPRSFSRRWAMPVSVAAVLVLAVGVTLRMQIEQPGIEYSVPDRQLEAPAPVPAPAVPEAAPLKESIESTMSYAQKPAPPTAARRSERAAARDSAKIPGSAPAASGEPALAKQERERKATAPAPFQPELSRSAPMEPAPAQAPAAPPPAAAAAPRAEELAVQAPSPRAKRATEPQAMGDMGLRASAVETPERRLERIAELRREGRHAEADDALTKFRREHPDFKIAPELWERVRPR